MQNYNREMAQSVEIDNIKHQPAVKVVSGRRSKSANTPPLPNSSFHLSHDENVNKTIDVGNANHKSVEHTPLHSSGRIATQAHTIQSQHIQTVQGQNIQPPINTSPLEPVVIPRDLTKPRAEWVQEDYVSFVRMFNESSSIVEIKKLLNRDRLEKIQALCSQCDLMGLPISKEKMREYFLQEREGRWRSPILKVCRGNYIRISNTLTEQHGLELKEGQHFAFSLGIEEDTVAIILKKLE